MYRNISGALLVGETLKELCWNLKQSMGARKRVGIGVSYWPARLHRLAELILWNQVLGYLNVLKLGLWLFLS
jgi:hypothetical protein